MPSKKVDTRGLEGFWRLLERLKLEPRQGWKEKLRLEEVESVADHSYGVAMLGLFQAWSKGGYDLERLLKLALLHDLDEAITGDMTPKDKRSLGHNEVLRRKRLAGRSVTSLVPEKARSEWIGLWTDLHLRRSKEAKLVKDLDLVEMALQANAYSRREVGKSRRPRVQEFYDSALRGVKNPELRRVVERIAGERRVRARR
jgi:putative hydrolase of HD superfamily